MEAEAEALSGDNLGLQVFNGVTAHLFFGNGVLSIGLYH